MKIEYHEDLGVPAAFVFRWLTDVGRHERAAQARGISVRRIDSGREAGPGAAWEIGFDYRGRQREARAEITAWNPPEKLRIDARSAGLDLHVVVNVVALSSALTRVHVSLNLVASTITAKLLVQSIKLARGSVTDRLRRRLSVMCVSISDAWARSRAPGNGT